LNIVVTVDQARLFCLSRATIYGFNRRFSYNKLLLLASSDSSVIFGRDHALHLRFSLGVSFADLHHRVLFRGCGVLLVLLVLIGKAQQVIFRGDIFNSAHRFESFELADSSLRLKVMLSL
jgi:hypothetical protein